MKHRAMFLSVGIGLASLLLGGCTQEDPSRALAPETIGQPEVTSVYSSEIGPQGGVLTGDVCVLSVPAGALSSSCTVTMTTSLVAGVPHAEFSHAVEFSKDCTVSLQRPSNASPGDVYRIDGWHASNGQWLPLGGGSQAAWVSGALKPEIEVQIRLCE